MRLQDTYKLNTSQLANGEISSKFKSKKLSGQLIIKPFLSVLSIRFYIALECYDLGRVAYTNGDFYHTLMWMQEALDHFGKETTNTSIKKIDILDHLAYATSQVRRENFVFQKIKFFFVQQGNIEHALAMTEEMLVIGK